MGKLTLKDAMLYPNANINYLNIEFLYDNFMDLLIDIHIMA